MNFSLQAMVMVMMFVMVLIRILVSSIATHGENKEGEPDQVRYWFNQSGDLKEVQTTVSLMEEKNSSCIKKFKILNRN